MGMKQRTFKVNDLKITIKSRPRTSCGNLIGFYVWINGERFFKNYLTRIESEDAAYSKWIKENH